jgi:hypothetical protein
LALAVCFVIAVAGGIHGLIGIAGVSWMRARVLQRLSLIFVPIACLVLVQEVLVRWAAREVREGPEYQFLFVLGAGAWLVVCSRTMLLLGISIREDVLQRHNPAALIAALGAMVGVTLAYAGANIGEGATIWTTFFPAVVGAVILFGCWMLMELPGRISPATLLDRDIASGLRLAGALTATGLILGRAGAGNWVSMEATLYDFVRLGWPALLIAVVAAMVHRWLAPSQKHPVQPIVSRGLIPAIVYVSLAALWCYYRRGG